ncbi:hypothetical protein COOONC_24003 [Cooperia oncophora]
MLALYAITIIFLKLVVAFPSAKLCSHEYPDCPNGCIRLLDSGYYMELVKLPFETARVEYLKRETTLCAPDSVEEWVDVVEHTSLNFRTWVGQKRTDERPPQWQRNTGRDNKKINRLVPPAIPEGNGWNPTPQCLAHPTIATPTFGILPSEMAKQLFN